jgi:type IV pilus assembly protein PilW
MKRASVKGFTLIELMIAMVLGLIVVAGVVSVMIANKRTYRTNEGLAQVQESARTAFELMARDIRQAGGNGCDNNNRTANVLDTAGGFWWQDWFGIRGIDSTALDPAVAFGTTFATRLAGTDSIHVQGIEGAGLPVQLHNAAANTIRVNAASTTFQINDIMLVCDMDHAAIFQATGYSAVSRTITHANAGTGPGNCASGLGFPTLCGGVGNIYTFPVNAQVSRLTAVDWYIGNNDRPDEGGRSLFRRRLDRGGVEVVEEVVAGVTELNIRYGTNGSNVIQDAGAVADWDDVNSVFITLTADSADSFLTTDAATNTGRIRRTFTYLITLRNHVQ